MRPSSRVGFSPIEILIIIVIVAVLAAIVIPQFSQTSDEARAITIAQHLHTLRSQIDRYRNQHEGRPPGTLGGADDDIEFAEQLTLPTNETGTRCPAPNQGVGNPNYPFGPYISTQLPSNPFNGSRRVKTVTEFPASAPGGDSASDPGWVYEISSGRIRLNQSGNAPDGTPFWNL